MGRYYTVIKSLEHERGGFFVYASTTLVRLRYDNATVYIATPSFSSFHIDDQWAKSMRTRQQTFNYNSGGVTA
jgi:hypothetical protein